MKIKHLSLYLLLFFCLLFLLFFPEEALRSSKEGLTLWMNSLIPTLLPFLIITGIFLHIKLPFQMPAFFQKISRCLFALSLNGLYCLALGLLCGYPMGAKMTSDFYSSGKIGKAEAEYLLTMSNNASPAFLLGYLSLHILQGKIPGHDIILLFLLSDFFCMLLFRFFFFRTPLFSSVIKDKKETPDTKAEHKKETPLCSSPGAIIDVSIMNGFETITRLGGYILLFSIISAMIRHYWIFSESGSILILGYTELITGLNALAQSGYSFQTKYMLSMIMTGFGGICILFQTRSVLNKELSLLPYLSAKIIQAAFLYVWILIF